jgi:hypothetical protein
VDGLPGDVACARRGEEVGGFRAVRLTPAGHARIEAAVRQLLEHEADLVSVLPDGERATLAGVLGALLGALSGDGSAFDSGGDDRPGLLLNGGQMLGPAK